MTDVNSQIRNTIESFVSELNELVRQAAMEAVTSALGASVPGGFSQPARRGRPPAAAKAPAAPAKRGPGRPQGRGSKRTAEELAQLAEQFVEYVTSNPGQRIEAIGAALGIETKVLALPVKKLVAEGRVKTEGQKRATSYFAGGGKGRKKG